MYLKLSSLHSLHVVVHGTASGDLPVSTLPYNLPQLFKGILGKSWTIEHFAHIHHTSTRSPRRSDDWSWIGSDWMIGFLVPFPYLGISLFLGLPLTWIILDFFLPSLGFPSLPLPHIERRASTMPELHFILVKCRNTCLPVNRILPFLSLIVTTCPAFTRHITATTLCSYCWRKSV